MNQNEALSYIPCGILIVDSDKKITFANEYILGLCGKEKEDVEGHELSAIGFSPEAKSRAASFVEGWWGWVENTPIRLRTCIEDLEHNRIPVFVSGRKMRDNSGELNLYLCIMDIVHLEDWTVTNEMESVSRDHFYSLVGKSPQMHELFNLIEMASSTGVNVVIQGESGTGKELVASAIHHASDRNGNSFVRVNCAALTETLLESELFGHVKGAFTGAYRDRKGTFESAHEGTVLLDEIGEISPVMQVKLLRVLQERVIVRVGDNEEIPVDVRILAATNKNLRALVKKGTFREDLFYRLNVFPIHVPSLRERKSDIPHLCAHFLKKYRQETGKNIVSVSPDTMRLLMDYCWPGNVRELENTIEHAFVLCRIEEIQVTDLPHELRVKVVREGICAEKTAGIAPQFSPIMIAPQKTSGRLNISREHLVAALEEHGGNKSATARSLGISNVGLWKKMKKLGIS